jgi:hypothetical protein
MLILSTPAFGTAGIAALFGMVAFTVAPAFGGTLALNVAPAFGTNFIWEGATFDGAAFDEAAPVPIGAMGALRAIVFWPHTFTYLVKR